MQMDSKDGQKWCTTTAGNVSNIFDSSDRPFTPLDIILAACDVEGNFMVVKVAYLSLQERFMTSPRHTNTRTCYHVCSSMPGQSLSVCSFRGCTCAPDTIGRKSL